MTPPTYATSGWVDPERGPVVWIHIAEPGVVLFDRVMTAAEARALAAVLDATADEAEAASS